MKVTCTRDNLQQGLSVVNHISSKNINLPILQNVLLKTEANILKLSTTNLEIAINNIVRGKIEKEGEFTIPSKLFSDYVALLPNETIDLELIDDYLMVTCGGYNTKIRGVVASEFPLIPPITANIKYTINSNDFKNALNQVIFAVANNESRPELSGVYFSFNNSEIGEETLVMASTDSYRLAEKVIKIDGISSKEKKSVIIPSKTLQEINRIISIFKDSVESINKIDIIIGENQIVFKYGVVELTSRIIEGKYPDYRQIIPNMFPTKAIVSSEGFVKAIKTASLFSKTGLFDVAINLNPDENNISISSTNIEKGENVTKTEADVQGQNNNITVNYKYLIDGVNALNNEKAIFQLIDANNPCMITPEENKEGESYTYIVMPIKQ